MTARGLRSWGLALATGAALGCSEGQPIEVVVPSGASLGSVTDSLAARGVIGWPTLFRGFTRLRGDQRDLKAGTYVFYSGWSWKRVLAALTEGRVSTAPLTVPEGLSLQQIAPRIAEITGEPTDSVLAQLTDSAAAQSLDVPGPGLEGYLFPDTYRFARGVEVSHVVGVMLDRYREVWTPERRALLEASGLSEREAVTLASIVQAEARHEEEMPMIASVYRNRLDRGMRLEADPTVLYALGGWRPRLLFAAMDSVHDHPYNTYTHAGLPPGPIDAPGVAAIDAVLSPADEPYLFFVAWPDGTHRFTRTLAEHNRAKAAADSARAANADSSQR